MNHRFLLIGMVACAGLIGCASGPVGSRLFVRQDKTSFRTPQVRIDEAREIAARSTRQDTPEQQQIVNDLAQRLPAEPDPIVREAIMQSVASFNTPLVGRVLLAGLNDADPVVRQRCCRALGARQQADSVVALGGLLENDESLDVRHAATRALGQIGTPDALQALSVALENRDPAMQLVGIEAARQAVGQDFGNDATAYLAHLKGNPPAVASRPETEASGVRRWLPF